MSVEPCPNCGSTEKTPEGACAKCGLGPDVAAPVMMQIYVITGAIFMSMLIYAGIAVMVTQSVVSKAVGDGAGFVPETVVGLGAVAMVASVFASLAAVKQNGPRAIVRGVILAAVLAEVPAICSLAATVLTGKLVWMAWGMGFALMAFLALAFQMPAIAFRIAEWAKGQQGS
jgi:hypothetical protein